MLGGDEIFGGGAVVPFVHGGQGHDPRRILGARALQFHSVSFETSHDGRVHRVHDPEVAAQTLWMSVHGLVALLITKKAFPFASRQVLIDEQLETIVRGLLTPERASIDD